MSARDGAGDAAYGFPRLLHAEWTKFRTVRGWVVGVAVAAAVIIGIGLAPGMQGSCGQHGTGSECIGTIGPDGIEVTDSFTFVHRPLTGDGSITVRVTSLTGVLPSMADGQQSRIGPAPWAKAGLIVKDGTRQGSTYAALMVTGAHGVRMQYDYVHDRAGPAGTVTDASPRWLRLTRAGGTVTGHESVDGVRWASVGTADLSGLPATVEVGLFATSPQHAEVVEGPLGAAGAAGGPTEATATFDSLDLDGTWADAATSRSAATTTDDGWTDTIIGGQRGPDGNGPRQPPGYRGVGLERSGERFTVTGSGDIAPAVSGAAGAGTTISQTLAGTFLGLVLLVVVGAMFVTAEYRRGLIRTTLAASAGRGRVLAAKAVILGCVTFVVGSLAATVVVSFGQRVLRDNGVYVHPATTATEVRLIAGTAAMLAITAVLALALGAMLRRSTTAVTAAVVGIVLPYLLAMTVLPAATADWLLRISPAAAFAVQQSATEYAQVANLYTPVNGYFPVGPWTGVAVLLGWTAVAFGLAVHLLRRRDA